MSLNAVTAVESVSHSQFVDPLEYLAQLNAKGVSFEVLERRRSNTKPLHATGRQKHVSCGFGLVGSERGSMLKGLSEGPGHVASYRSSYSLDALLKLEQALVSEAAEIAAQRKWRLKDANSILRRSSILALAEKYFNVCTICHGSTQKKDRKPCKSCHDGFSKRTQRACGKFLGVDHKSYAKTWKSRVELLINVLDEWERQARIKILMNVQDTP